jgi:hypothetical protein
VQQLTLCVHYDVMLCRTDVMAMISHLPTPSRRSCGLPGRCPPPPQPERVLLLAGAAAGTTGRGAAWGGEQGADDAGQALGAEQLPRTPWRCRGWQRGRDASS